MVHHRTWPAHITSIALAVLVLSLGQVRPVFNRSASAAEKNDDVSNVARHDFSQLLSSTGGLELPTPATSQSPTFGIQSLNGNTSTLQAFPHTFLYGGPNSSGWPMVGSTAPNGTCANNPARACAVNIDCGDALVTCNNPSQVAAANTPLNAAELDMIARYPMGVFAPTPLSDGRPDIIPALRARNPNMKIFAYVVGHDMWCPQDGNGNNSYPAGYFYRDYYLGVNNNNLSCTTTSDHWLWNQDGTRSGYDVNLAHRVDLGGGNYKYDVAENIADAIYSHAKASKNFDGIFIDIFCPGYLWAENGSNPWDYARAGYPDRAAFDAGWLAGHQAEAERLRADAIADGHPDYPIAANCAQAPSSEFPVINGWMREAFPAQNGGTFYSNMTAYPWGFYNQDYMMRAPQYNYVFTAAAPSTTPYTILNQQKMRFGLGAATMGNGYHAFEDSIAAFSTDNYAQFWYDEYGVDTTVPQNNSEWGKAKSGPAYSGWLGQPMGDMYNLILPTFTNAADKLTTNQSFETTGSSPSNIVGWNVGANGGSVVTAVRDTTTAAPGAGSASAHFQITQIGSTPANVILGPTATFPITANQQYSVTFWAKASSVRSTEIVVANGPWPAPSVVLSTEWKRYQMQVKPTVSTNSGYFYFVLGYETGDIWIDDVHVQAGASSVMRRDFEHGSVILNPTDTQQVVTLEKPYRKILGTVNPTLNDGSLVSSVTISGTGGGVAGDAVFLLSVDGTPPSAVGDLAAQ